MTTSKLLADLGVFLRPGFLGAALCRELTSAVTRSPGHSAEVFAPIGLETSTRLRNATEHEPTPGGAFEMSARLDEMRPALAAHFRVPLTSAEPLSFLTYRTGQFYKPHADRGRPGETEAINRAVSVVVFLNDAQSPIAFTGGQLILFDLLDDPRARGIGLPLEPEAGLLVAFRSEIVHEVALVRSGTRAVIVAWFHHADRREP